MSPPRRAAHAPRVLADLDVDAVVHTLRARASALAEGGPLQAPDATPRGELARTPAAAHVAEEAARQGLFHFHFEHRIHLELPEAWLPDTPDATGEAPTWADGVLPEQKYHSFRHDLLVASYHPQHRAKWAAHELCHGLVGFAWRPDATPFFHATAGRLAELLPVALWYFFDEAFLRRCDAHQGDGALYRVTCPACEAAARSWPDDDRAVEQITAGLRFVDRELAAVARSRREGRPLPHRHATLDLCSDGVAYAAAHARRLGDPGFAHWIERFAVAGGGWSPSLDELEARVLDVLGAVLGVATATPLAPSALHGHWRWLVQDLGGRLTQVATEAPPARREALDALADDLAALVPATTEPTSDVDALGRSALVALAVGLEPLHLDAEVLGTGYLLPGHPPVLDGLLPGLPTATPLLADLLGERVAEAAEAFARYDLERPRRAPLATRWASWWAAQQAPALADLAAWEAAALTCTTPLDEELGPARDPRRRLAAGVQVLHAAHDVLDLAARVDTGGLQLASSAGWALEPVDGRPLERQDTALLLAREPGGELLVLDLDPETARALEALGPGAVPDLLPDEQEALEEHGVLVPVAVLEQHPVP